MSNFRKLTPAIALTTAVIVLVAGIIMVLYTERSYRELKTDEVTVQARILASAVSAALAFNDHKAAQEYVNALKANPEVQIVAIYDGKGKLFAGYSRVAGVALPLAPPSGEPLFSEDRLMITVPVDQRGTTLGTVYLQNLTEPIQRRLERYGVIVLLMTMASLVFVVLGVAQAALNKANAKLELQAAGLAEANRNLRAQIEEREKAEAALRQAQKMEAIGQLTGGVAHDFNNILQVILGNLDALRRDLTGAEPRPATHDHRRWIAAAIRGAERAATLTQRLLAFSRRQPLAPKPIEVNKLVAGMSDLLRRTLGETITIEAVLAAGLWRISADGNQLESALLNLAVNARDAMPQGGKLTIETANAFLDEAYVAGDGELKAGQYVMIAVTDTGSGMSRDIVIKAFEPFFTTKDIGHGTGLGLSQVYGFVKQSGGHVKIYSEPGEGTTIKLYLPRLPGALGPGEVPADVPHFAEATLGETILVVEDDEDVRVSTVEMLRQLGYGVIEAADGPTALRLLDAQPAIRLLFTDVGLPNGLNGRQLADEATRRRPDLKVLFATGYARNAIVHQGRLDPGVELIGKPFTAAALAAKIRQVLEAAPETRK